MASRLREAFAHGVADALAVHGLKHAAEEIRLKIPRREFHGWDSAFRGEKQKNEKKADGMADPLEPQGDPDTPVERFTDLLQNDHVPGESPDTAVNPLDRNSMWSGPSSLAAGDAGSRISDMGQSTGVGAV